MNNLFEGRVLHCKNCGWEFSSQPKLESMWTTIQVDNQLIDICPFCWGIPSHAIPQQVKDLRKTTYHPKGK